MTLHLHIERLVLDGLSLAPAQGAQLGAALERELARLLDQGRLNAALAGGGHHAALRAAPLTLHGGSAPEALGTQIAAAVYGQVGATP